MNIRDGVDIHHHSDLPPRAGLGTSSSFAVGLIHALNALKGKIISKRQMALDAIHIEQNQIKENVGSQDQVSAAFGGLNKIEFNKDQEFIVKPLTLTKNRYELFQEHLMLFFTGFSRTASEIAEEQIKKTPQKEADLQKMYKLVEEAINVLNDDGQKLSKFGEMLHENWMIKRKLTSKITNQKIDDIYETGIKAGATGGKILGAGGGGFMLFFVKPEKQSFVKRALKDYLYVPFRFDSLGSQVIYYMGEETY